MSADLCELCERPLADGRPVQRSLDGTGVHLECLEDKTNDEGEEDE